MRRFLTVPFNIIKFVTVAKEKNYVSKNKI